VAPAAQKLIEIDRELRGLPQPIAKAGGDVMADEGMAGKHPPEYDPNS